MARNIAVIFAILLSIAVVPQMLVSDAYAGGCATCGPSLFTEVLIMLGGVVGLAAGGLIGLRRFVLVDETESLRAFKAKNMLDYLKMIARKPNKWFNHLVSRRRLVAEVVP